MMCRQIIACLCLALLALAGCSSCGSNEGEADDTVDTGADADVDADGDADADADADGDADADADADGDTDADSDGDADADVDADADMDIDTDVDTDTSLIPHVCELVVASSAMHWEAERGIYEDRMVWMAYDFVETVPKLKMRQLSTGETTTLIADPGYEEHPVIWGDWVFWEQEMTSPDWRTKEIFRMNLGDMIPQRLTDDNCADGSIRPGENYVVHLHICDTSEVDPLYYTNVDTLVSTQITPDASSIPGLRGIMFDGQRYAAWGWYEESADHKDQVYLFDIQNPAPPGQPLLPEAFNQMGGVIADGKIYVTTGIQGFTEGWDIWIYELDTGEASWLDHAPYDQINAVADGDLVAYLDTEDLGSHYWLNGGYSYLELKDQGTGVTRRVSASDTGWWGLALSGKYLMFAQGYPGISVWACDLEAAGFIDADGHVCPESGCLLPDGGT